MVQDSVVSLSYITGLGVLPVLLEFMFLLCMRLRFHGFMSAYRFIRLFGIWWRVVPSGFNILLG